MTGTLSDYWDAISPSISPDLISTESLHDLSTVGQHFPSTIASLVGFECRLAEASPQADLFLRVVPQTGGRDILAGAQAVETRPKFYHLLAGCPTIPNLSPELIDHPVWQKIRQFCIQWSTPNTSFYNHIKDLWIEFDLETNPPKIPIPSVFFGSDLASLETGLNLLLDHPVSPEQHQQIDRIFNILPKTASLFQAGVLLSRRHSQTIRFYIADISTKQISVYLDKIGWKGDRKNLETILMMLAPGIKKTNLQLELESKIATKIAIECYFENRDAWQIFLDRLVKTGFCLPQKRDAILKFGGMTREKDSPQNWPQHLQQRSQLLGSQWESVLFRRLAYLKMTYCSGKPLEFKAYLGVQPGWIDPQFLNN
ncbi:MAG: hypothetical protein AAFO04_19890 [Cyanobacteria bacterium J06592_8]